MRKTHFQKSAWLFTDLLLLSGWSRCTILVWKELLPSWIPRIHTGFLVFATSRWAAHFSCSQHPCSAPPAAAGMMPRPLEHKFRTLVLKTSRCLSIALATCWQCHASQNPHITKNNQDGPAPGETDPDMGWGMTALQKDLPKCQGKHHYGRHFLPLRQTMLTESTYQV